MATVRASFEGPEDVRRALLALRGYGASDEDITVSAEAPDVAAESTMTGVMAGAAAGSIAGAVVTAATALVLPMALPAVAALSFGGAAMGGVGGSVAGAILGGGEGAKSEQKAEDAGESEPNPARMVVSVVTPEEQVPALEATLAQLGGRLQHEAA